MKFLAFVFAVLAAIASIGTLLLGFMLIFTDDPHAPVLPWGYTLVFIALLMILLGVVSAVLIGTRPWAAKNTLWLLILGGVIAMVGATVASFQLPGPIPERIGANLVPGGLLPTLAGFAAQFFLSLHLRSSRRLATEAETY